MSTLYATDKSKRLLFTKPCLDCGHSMHDIPRQQVRCKSCAKKRTKLLHAKRNRLALGCMRMEMRNGRVQYKNPYASKLSREMYEDDESLERAIALAPDEADEGAWTRIQWYNWNNDMPLEYEDVEDRRRRLYKTWIEEVLYE